MKRFGRRDQPAVDPTAAADQYAQGALTAVQTAMRVSELRARALKRINPAAAVDMPGPELKRQLEQIIHDIANDERYEPSAREQNRLAEELANDMTGYGPLEPLLRDATVTDIMVNGPASVYVERASKLERTAIRFRNTDHIASIAQKIAARVGRRIDESSPMVDARLHDGSRVNVIFPPLSIDSPCISIRKFSRQRLDFATMVENGSMSSEVARLRGIAARCRLNVLISGGTGSGRTTLLNAMSQMIDNSERIISVEDAAEPQLRQPHVIRLETRPNNLECQGAVLQREPLRNALRMRPDRIILGEVRGEEAFDMLQAMNTSHDGSISTVHAAPWPPRGSRGGPPPGSLPAPPPGRACRRHELPPSSGNRAFRPPGPFHMPQRFRPPSLRRSEPCGKPIERTHQRRRLVPLCVGAGATAGALRRSR